MFFFVGSQVLVVSPVLLSIELTTNRGKFKTINDRVCWWQKDWESDK